MTEKKTEKKGGPERDRGGAGTKTGTGRAPLAWASPLTGALLTAAALVVAAFAVYSNTFSVPFHLDDFLNIVENKYIHNLEYLWPPAGTRYLAYLTFAINYAVGGVDPFGYHMVNTIVHAASGVLLWRLIILTSRTPLMRDDESFTGAGAHLALVAAMVFIVHPIQTQAVTYITQRFASLATLLYLAAVVFYVHARLGGRSRGVFALPRSYFASLLFTVAAMKTKEISFTIPFVLALYEYAFFTWTNHKDRIMHLVPFALTLLVIPLSLFSSELGLGAGLGIAEKIRVLQIAELTGIPWHEYFLIEIGVVVTYLKLLVLPVGQNVIHDFQIPSSIFAPSTFISFVFLTTLFTGAAWLLAWSKKNKAPFVALASFGVLWFFITLSVESSIIPIKDVIFEHRLYLPSAGAAVTFASLIYMGGRFVRERMGSALPLGRFTGVVLVLTALPLAVAAFERNKVWSDPMTLWTDVVAKNPHAPLAYAQLGVAWADAGDMEKAIDNHLRAMSLAPRSAYTRNNLGVSYAAVGRTDEAINEFKIAVSLDKNYTDAYFNMALAYQGAGKMAEAARNFKKTVDLDPVFAEAHSRLGLVYASLRRVDNSTGALEEAARLDPENGEYRNNLGFAYFLAGRYEEATGELKAALALDGGLIKARRTLMEIKKKKKGEVGASTAPTSP